MIITIKSENPEFSYLINKNPASPPRVCELRKGYVMGWFKDGYHMNFIEGFDESSFGGQEFEYLDASKYCHPFIINKCIDSLLTKLSEKYDGQFKTQINITSLDISDKLYSTVVKHFTELTFTRTEFRGGYFKLQIESEIAFARLLKIVQIIGMYWTLADRLFYTHDSLSEKYVQLLCDIDAPYFIRYVLKQKLIKNNKDAFTKYESLFNCSTRDKLEMCSLDNWEARFSYVSSHIDFSKPIIDVGCGEGRYMSRLAKRVSQYYCIDTDAEALAKCERRVARKGFTNVVVQDNYNNLPEGANIICSEVIEHIELEKLVRFVDSVKQSNPHKIIITTPNKKFNQYYKVDSRHEDHVNEFDLEEIVSIFGQNPHSIGDIVNDEPTTFGIVIDG